MRITPAPQHPEFHKKLLGDVDTKLKAWLALAGKVSEIGVAGREKDAALARLEVFNRGDLIPDTGA